MRVEFMIGEHARCLFKMSEALYQVPGREAEADRLLKEAEELYWKKVGCLESVDEKATNFEIRQRAVTEEEYDSLVFVAWR